MIQSYYPSGITGGIGPAKECPPGTMHDRTRGGSCVDIELLKKEGKFDLLFPKCGPETGTEPDGKGGCRPIGRPSSEPQPQPTKTMGIGSNWLLPAILVGVGIYLITRKSE